MLAPLVGSSNYWHPVCDVWISALARHCRFRCCLSCPRRYSQTMSYSLKSCSVGGGCVGRHGIFFFFFGVSLDGVPPYFPGLCL